MLSQQRFLVGILIFELAFTSTQSFAEETDKYTNDVKQLLLWLPAKTEALTVMRKPISSIKRDETVEHFNPASIDGIDGALHFIRRGKFRKQLANSPIALSAQASCGFREPESILGATRFDGCQLVLFQEDIGASAAELLKSMEPAADASFDLRGRKVLRFNETWRNDKWTFFVAFPTPQMLVVAFDEQFLRDLIERIDTTPTTSFIQNEQLEADLPLKADVWAVRRYRHPMIGIVPGAIGFLFELVDKEQAKVTFYTAEKTDLPTVENFWTLPPPSTRAPVVKQLKVGIFEIQHNIKKDGTAFWLLLMMRMGHAATF